MSKFGDDFKASANDVLENMFGISITYTPVGQSGLSITARWYPDQMLPDYLPDGEQVHETGVLVVNPDDVKRPTERDTATINGVVWAVVMVRRSAHSYECQVERREQRRIEGVTSRIQR